MLGLFRMIEHNSNTLLYNNDHVTRNPAFVSSTGLDKHFFCVQSGDDCIQIFHLGRYIVGYTVGNLVLRGRASGAVKRDFRTYIIRYTSPNENFEYGYPHSNALLHFVSNWSVGSRIKQHVAKRNVTKLMTSNYFRQYIAGYIVAIF